MIKRSILQEDITIINVNEPHIGAPKYIQQILTNIKGKIESNLIIVGDFTTPLTSMDRPSRQKINKETLALNDPLDQMDFIDIYRTFYPKSVRQTFFPSAQGIFTRIDHILGHKTSLSKFKETEII